MIDDERVVDELTELLNEHLPIRAYVTAPLVKALGRKADIKLNDAVEINSVLYLGDEGGIACEIGLWGDSVVVTSLTHLRIANDHPLAERIQAYQLRRSQCLAGTGSANSRKSRANLGAWRKRKRKA